MTPDDLEPHRRLLRLRLLEGELRDLSLVFLRRSASPRGAFDLKAYLNSIEREAVALGIDGALFRRLLGAATRSLRQCTEVDVLLRNTRNAVAPLVELVAEPLKAQEQVVAAEPPSADKAKRHLRAVLEDGFPEGSCELVALMADELPPGVTDALELRWKTERDRREGPVVREVFWSSSLEMTEWEATARYRVWERFQFPGFDRAFAEVESDYEEAVAGASCWPHESRSAANVLWHATRSRRLSTRLSGTLASAFQRVADAQQSDGSWHLQRLDLPRKRARKRSALSSSPDCRATALLCAALLRGSESERAMDAAVRGVRWLLAKQKPDGSWADTDSATKESDFFVTAVTLDAIGRTDVPGAVRAIRDGQKWILGRQKPDGGWAERGLPWAVAAAVALEALEAGKRLSRARDQYATASVGLVVRANQLAREDTPTSRRLAVIAAAHGVEAFLYSVLSVPSINANVWEDKSQTIGMRRALALLQEHLQRQKLLKPNETVAYRSPLGSMQYCRDQVVHKAANVSSEECCAGVKAAQDFIVKYSSQLLGFNLLD